MADEKSTTLTTECLIAFGNLRASTLASAHLLAEKNPGDLPLARELVADHLARGMQMPVGPADVTQIPRELTSLCQTAAALLMANRRRAVTDETLAVAARRLDADLCIARGVLNALPAAPEAPERESYPPDPARRTG